ncbi:MAG TPA: macro domain-containing protein [Pyrinomonadaceae bacterium]|jgi:O-acetyl-ADP-ribose deacetylase (regulator of RNase III)|nr:macro domain-containing protein [Pyrinomonadaceae bacterium]
MIKVVQGNLLEADVEALVNTVNTVGVMGKGIALQFRKAFPENYKAYLEACKNNEIEIGKVHVFATNKFNPKFIINFPTKKHWRAKSKIRDIEAGLIDLAKVIKHYEIKSIAIPPLGCGNGGLNWDEVKPLIESALTPLKDVEIYVYSPTGSPEAIQMKVATKKPNLTSVRAALLALFKVYLLPGYRLSMLEAQKLAYLLQVAGEPLRLKFEKKYYGPYAENLHHLLQRIDGHFIRGYGDRTQKVIDQTIELIPEAFTEVDDFLFVEKEETLERLARVSRLIEGFEYPYGMELLSTVHWVSAELEEERRNLKNVVLAVHSWSSMKKEKFSPREIKIAWQRLRKQKWV